jgi:hypothetical protein
MNFKYCWPIVVVTLLLILWSILYFERKPVFVEPPANYVWAKMDPNSSRTYTTILLPELNRTYEQMEELKAQNKWLRRNLDKCLDKLEAERGLKPIRPKYPLPLKGEPNLGESCLESSEPWLVPYEEPNAPSMLEEPVDSIKLLKAAMGVRGVADRGFIESSVSWIENFEKRLKRLDHNQP